jgi:hypothetical protein
MISGPTERQAYSLFKLALAGGYPARAKDALSTMALAPAVVAELSREYARGGHAAMETKANSVWLIPLEPVVSLDEFHVMLSQGLLEGLNFAFENKIFPYRALVGKVAEAEGVDVTPRLRKLVHTLWNLDLVTHRGAAGTGDKLFSISARGRAVVKAGADYRIPTFADRADAADLAKFSRMIEL